MFCQIELQSHWFLRSTFYREVERSRRALADVLQIVDPSVITHSRQATVITIDAENTILPTVNALLAHHKRGALDLISKSNAAERRHCPKWSSLKNVSA